MTTSGKILVTGATGQFGGLALDALSGSVPPERLVAGVRDPGKPAAIALAERGIAIRTADYARPDTLVAAFEGVDSLLLVSGSEIGSRVAQHRNVIDAARNAGVSLIAYTSILHADRSPLFLAEEHLATEAILRESGVPFVLLRNGWYSEVVTWRLPLARSRGALMGAAGAGRIASAARADYASAAAAVLTTNDHAGRTYELAGDTAFTLAELAAFVSSRTGQPFPYRDMTRAAFHDALVEAGVPELFATILSDTDAGIEQGALFDGEGALSRLLGRPTVPFERTIGDFIA